jgi:hypothetical protein
MNRRTFAFGTLFAIGLVTAEASNAELLTPWEKFCLNTNKPGQDLANCLDGLPSGGGRNKVLLPQPKPHNIPCTTGQSGRPGVSTRRSCEDMPRRSNGGSAS